MIENKETSKETSKERKHPVDVLIPPECMDDNGECEHTKRPARHEQNPV